MRPHIVALALAALSSVVSLSGPAAAQAWRPRPPPAPTCSMDILVNGAPRTQRWLGADAFVEGSIGERYVIRVHNPSWRRVEAVVSVDGRDAIDGQPSNTGKRGYVIAPYSYVDIEGFRLSMADVAAFRFTTVRDSYASRMGTPWNVGVIEVAIFPERARIRYPSAAPRAESSAADGDQASERYRRNPRAQGLGTEFGESRSSPVVETMFIRENPFSPAQRIRIRYDDRQGLCSRGLRELCPQPPYDPYPYSYDDAPPRRFAQPPPGWGYER